MDDLLTDKYFDIDIHGVYGMRQYSIFMAWKILGFSTITFILLPVCRAWE